MLCFRQKAIANPVPLDQLGITFVYNLKIKQYLTSPVAPLPKYILIRVIPKLYQLRQTVVMIKTYYAGQELDAPCGRCKGETRHWILSITDKVPGKLICTGCKSVHKFRTEKPKGQTPAPQKPHTAQNKNKAGHTPTSKFQELIIAEQPEIDTIPCYSTSQKWNEGMWIKHPNFGLGKVQKCLGRKIDVLFRDGIKTLISI